MLAEEKFAYVRVIQRVACMNQMYGVQSLVVLTSGNKQEV
jgi:hypothetical protein